MEKIYFIDFMEYIADGGRESDYPAAFDTYEGMTFRQALEESSEGEEVPADPEDTGWEKIIMPKEFRKYE